MFDLGQKNGLMGLAERVVRAFEKQAEDPQEPTATPKTGSDYVPMTVESFDNHIYYWASINTDRCLDLIKRIRQADNDLRTQRESRMLPDDYPAIPIWLHIQSGGGDLFTGLNVADQLQTIQTPIYSIVEGVCASAATLVSMACTKRFIQSNSFMLIHQLSSWGFGTYEQLEDDMHVMEMLMDRLYEFYGSKTGFSKKEVKDVLRRDSWFSAQECLENGMVDEVLT
jgi:ATP-dependent protease ClpP protease subunit